LALLISFGGLIVALLSFSHNGKDEQK